MKKQFFILPIVFLLSFSATNGQYQPTVGEHLTPASELPSENLLQTFKNLYPNAELVRHYETANQTKVVHFYKESLSHLAFFDENYQWQKTQILLTPKTLPAPVSNYLQLFEGQFEWFVAYQINTPAKTYFQLHLYDMFEGTIHYLNETGQVVPKSRVTARPHFDGIF